MIEELIFHRPKPERDFFRELERSLGDILHLARFHVSFGL